MRGSGPTSTEGILGRLPQLRQHLGDFVAAYNFVRRLKPLRGLTPYEAICKAWTQEPSRFTTDPHHRIPRPNTSNALKHQTFKALTVVDESSIRRQIANDPYAAEGDDGAFSSYPAWKLEVSAILRSFRSWK